LETSSSIIHLVDLNQLDLNQLDPNQLDLNQLDLNQDFRLGFLAASIVASTRLSA